MTVSRLLLILAVLFSPAALADNHLLAIATEIADALAEIENLGKVMHNKHSVVVSYHGAVGLTQDWRDMLDDVEDYDSEFSKLLVLFNVALESERYVTAHKYTAAMRRIRVRQIEVLNKILQSIPL